MTVVRETVAALLRGSAARSCVQQILASSNVSGRGVTLAAMAISLGFASAAGAQQASDSAAPSASDNVSLDEVTVTGSRIRRSTDFDSANPTTVVDSDYLKNMGVANVSQALQMLPSNVSTFSATNTGNSNFFAGSTIANLRGLNPFFGSRTLNLVDGRRFVPTNQGDGVDLNFIPFVLIDRVDVVTGGASAAYGSGAISGVNNIMLNRKLEGGLAQIDFGESGESDARDRHVGLAYGTGLFNDRGHFVLGYEYQKSDAVGCYEARDWCREGNAFVAGGPGLQLVQDARFNQLSQTGVFQNSAPGATTTLQTNAAGTGTTVFNIGSGVSTSPFNNVSGGDGESIYQYTNLRAPVKRNVATGAFMFDVNDDTHLNVDLSYGKVETDNRTQGLTANFTAIGSGNAYLTPALAAARTQFAIFPGGPAFFNKDWTSQINSHSATTTDVRRGAIGLDGKFGASTWTWDGYLQYGKTEREQIVFDNRHLNAYNLAIDSVIVNGVARCRISNAAEATAAGVTYDPRLANGCVPINPFGTGAISDAAKAYAFGNLDEQLDYKQSVAALNVTGHLFEGWGAGAITAAVGAEYRVEKGENIAAVPAGTADYVRTDYLIQYGESFAGKVNVTEGYVETYIPFLKDVPGAKLIDLDLAARVSEYKNKGGFGTTGEERTHDMTTWKISANWVPIDWLRFRATQSRDSRAANFRELYYGQIINAGGIFGFCSPNSTDPCNWSLEGNVDLKPEKADTTTFGIVFTPDELLPGFQFAADYFKIKISDAIQQANVTRVLDGCRVSGIQEFCALINPDVPGVYTYNPATNTGVQTVRALSFNGSGYKYEGIDFTSSYLWQLTDSNVNFRLLATKMMDQNFQNVPGGPFINVVGQTGTGNSFLSDNQPTAEWQATLSATYNRGPLAVTGNVRYVSDGIMDYNGVVPPAVPGPGQRGISVNHVPSYQVFGLTSSYTFENVGPLKTFQVWGAVDNVFDKEPPIAVGGGAFGASNANGGTNAIFFDTLGRTFKLGLRTSF
jgi:outer membrane receptor protein involved in Fe transport